MKSFLIASILCTSSAFAASMTKITTRTIATETNTNAAATPALFVAPAAEKRAYFTTNLTDLAQGTGNVAVDFFLNQKISAGFSMHTNSNRETVKHNGQEGKMTVDRVGYGLGASYWFGGTEAAKTLVINPFLAFGTKKDALYSDNSSGFGLKVTGVFHLTHELAAEVGGKGDSLDDGAFKGGLYAGIGYLF